MRQSEVGRVEFWKTEGLKWLCGCFVASVSFCFGGELQAQGAAGLGAAPEWLEQAVFESLFQEFVEPDGGSGSRWLAGEPPTLVDRPVVPVDAGELSTGEPPAVNVIERGPHHRVLRQQVDSTQLIAQYESRLREVSGRLAESVSREGVDLGVLAQDFSGEELGESSLALDLSSETKRAMAMQNEVDFLKGQIEDLRTSPELEYQEHTELGSGMHYWSPAAQAWRESDPRIELVNGVAVARRGQQRVLFAPDLSSKGSVDISTPAGRRLKGTVLGLVYLDAASGRDVIIASVKPTLGELVGENQLVYVDAFDGVKADVVYTYERSGLEQDVVLKARLPDPASFGLDPDTTRLEVMTEFFDAPEPEVSEQVLHETHLDNGEDSIAFKDQRLGFGGVQMAMGRTFWRAGAKRSDQADRADSVGESVRNERERPIGPNGEPAGLEWDFPESVLPIAKHWLKQDGKTVLCEGIDYRTIKSLLDDLPLAPAPQPRPAIQPVPEFEKVIPIPGLSEQPRFLGRVSQGDRGRRQVPDLASLALGRSVTGEIVMAQAATLEAMAAPGVVMDYQTLSTSSGYRFERGRTYYIYSDFVVQGPVVIEGGTIIKYRRSTSTNKVGLRCLGSVICETEPYQPAILTASDDYQYGPAYWPYTPPSGYYATEALWIEPNGQPVEIKYLRIKHAAVGVRFVNSPGARLRHTQILDCRYPVATMHQDLRVENVLIDGFRNYAFWAYHSWNPALPIQPGEDVNIHAEHVTVANGPHLSWNSHWNGVMGTTEFRNSLLVNVNGGIASGTYHPGDIGDVFINSEFLPHVAHDSVFQSQGLGSFYLPSDSPYRDAGHAAIDPLLAMDLRERTTSAPNVIEGYVRGRMGPVNDLDDDGAFDLGYHYDPIDHAIHYAKSFGSIWVDPGTIVACSGGVGLFIQHRGYYHGVKVFLEGEVGNRVRCVDDETVQEQGFPHLVGWSSMMHFAQTYIPHELHASFTDVYGLGRHTPLRQYYGNSFFGKVSFSDSSFHGVNINLKMFYANDQFSATNVLFNRCRGFGVRGGSGRLNLINCLFHRTPLYLSGDGGSLYSWSIRRSIFDESRLYGKRLDSMQSWQFHNNAIVGTLNWSDWPYWRMQPVVNVPAPFDWRSGPLGDFYQPTSGNPFLNKSSYSANSWSGGRLTHYTVREDLLPEGTSRTDLGYHYIATDPNGNPLDDNLDGIPNYLQDTNQNGVVDNGEVNWRVPFVDRDRDGLSDSVELALGTNPNLSDTDGDGLNDFVEVRIGADPLPPENWSLNQSFGNRVITSQPSHAARQH